MAFYVDDFRAEMQGDGARPNLFDITLIFPPILGKDFAGRKVTFMANSTTLPPSSVGVAAVNYFGRQVKFPGDRVFPDWTINIINDEDFAIKEAFEAWSSLLNSHNQIKRNPGAVESLGYACPSVYVTQYSKNGVALRSYEFVGLFPTNVDPINVNWGSNDQIEEFGVTFAYQYWESRETQMWDNFTLGSPSVIATK